MRTFRAKEDATEPMLDPDAIADVYWDLFQQNPTSWSWELDVRPKGEAFFE